MILEEKPLNEIAIDDIQQLIDNQVPESKQLDYKSEIDSIVNNNKDEFLFDVCAFANTSGGWLIYGVAEYQDRERKGYPEKLTPITGITFAEIKQRIENSIRDKIEPRLSITYKEIKIEDRFILILHIAHSFNAPHTIKDRSYFYARNNSGKHRMDVMEIRTAFMASDVLEQKIKRWRDDRLAHIYADETPVPLMFNDRLVVHIISSSALMGSIQIPFDSYDQLFLHSRFAPMPENSGASRFNIDGFIRHTAYSSLEKSSAYTQVFRIGATESVTSKVSGKFYGQDIETFFVNIEENIYRCIEHNISSLLEVMVDLPLFVFITLMNVRGIAMGFKDAFVDVSAKRVDRDFIYLPDLFITEWPCDLGKSLKPTFDAFWNACGFAKSNKYDNDGFLKF